MDETKGHKRFYPGKESLVLLAVCLIDLVLTLWLVSTHCASEGNPLMAFYLRQGWETLVIVKLLLVLLPLFIAEWGRIYRPKFVRHILRIAIALYVGIYALAFVDTDIFASAQIVLPK